jgi:large subunit ribosomal protein L17
VRHRVYGSKLQRSKNERIALFRSLIRELVLHESISTTIVKAKAIKGQVDKLITKAKKNDNASKRVLESYLPQSEIRKKLVEEIAPRFSDRASGYTNVVRLGSRLGDGAMMVKVSFVEGVKVAEKEEKKDDTKKPVRRGGKKEEVTASAV